MIFPKKIQYWLLLGCFRLIGLLPDWVLYEGLGRLIYTILYRIAKYRRKVVHQNLVNSFPEKGCAEITKIEKLFYENLTEAFVDTLKLTAISRRNYMKRVSFKNMPEQEKQNMGRSWIAAMSHFGPWEFATSYTGYTRHSLLCVYRPLHSVVVDNIYMYLRSRFGARPVAMNNIYREMITSLKDGGQRVIVAMIADQTPPQHEIHCWFKFFGQNTPFFVGLEKLAVRFGTPVYFTYVRKLAKRHYEIEFQLIYDGKEEISENEVVMRYVLRLEEMIRETPELWIWSHKRWKHTPDTVGKTLPVYDPKKLTNVK